MIANIKFYSFIVYFWKYFSLNPHLILVNSLRKNSIFRSKWESLFFLNENVHRVKENIIIEIFIQVQKHMHEDISHVKRHKLSHMIVPFSTFIEPVDKNVWIVLANLNVMGLNFLWAFEYPIIIQVIVVEIKYPRLSDWIILLVTFEEYCMIFHHCNIFYI